MRKMGMLMIVAMGLDGMGCASTELEPTAALEAGRPVLRMFGNGSGRIVEIGQGVVSCRQAWEIGVMPGARSHGAPVRDSGWAAQREGTFSVTSRTQLFADGTTIFRELTSDASGHLVRIRFHDTHSDGRRQGFRVDGHLSDPVAFGVVPIGGILSADAR